MQQLTVFLLTLVLAVVSNGAVALEAGKGKGDSFLRALQTASDGSEDGIPMFDLEDEDKPIEMGDDVFIAQVTMPSITFEFSSSVDDLSQVSYDDVINDLVGELLEDEWGNFTDMELKIEDQFDVKRRGKGSKAAVLVTGIAHFAEMDLTDKNVPTQKEIADFLQFRLTNLVALIMFANAREDGGGVMALDRMNVKVTSGEYIPELTLDEPTSSLSESGGKAFLSFLATALFLGAVVAGIVFWRRSQENANDEIILERSRFAVTS
eukprot:CAMPEP_0118694740 /NCGR_PEP_ID=MMETSP0800-20121206/12737_1 /TAXON_ID=210618 ORGANISM="Striatella unipunctata, Strain CCMP2910" /NCGR_SAMPLE_ID=MMETSP0800 /ASSEMBLY_ACC=CAM_ASM_000638 /LENGTH=264 /DNA_ID=CAMNT_0006593331 /DNA_START=45 /DNA_END=839 /DNA_ORIENTATION=-